jgi:hypothetical protein
VDLHALKKQGWTNKEIAGELGYHPDTISRWLRSGPPVRVEVPDERRVMTSAWRSRIETLLGVYERLLAVSVFNKLRAEGFAGSYPTVVRASATSVGRGSGRRRPCRCRSTPTRARRTSSTSATSTTSPSGGGGIIRCAVSARSRAGPASGCGGSPPRRTSTTPSKAWLEPSRPSAGSRPWRAPTAWARVATIVLSGGGEVLLNPDVPDLLAHARQLGVRVHLYRATRRCPKGG